MTELARKRCVPCEGKISPLTSEVIQKKLSEITAWELVTEKNEIKKKFRFKDYYETIAFVNALAFMAHQEGHHPDLEVSYNRCIVRYSTHAVSGLTENDFICAAKVDKLFN